MLKRTMVGLKTLMLLIFILYMDASLAFAMPAISTNLDLSQPNGASFEANLNGDEWNNWVSTTSDDSVIIQDDDGYWKYAEVSFGELKPSGARVAVDPLPENNVQNGDWLDALVNYREDGKVPTTYYASPPPPPSSAVPLQPAGGPQQILVLLVSFTDVSIQYSEAIWKDKFFGDTGKTVKNFFKENSGGNFYFTPASETYGTANDGIVKVTLGYAHPNTGGSTGDANRLIVKNALIAADPYVNFASYDTNGNGNIDFNELHVVTITAGYERSYNTTTPSVWGHRWSLGWSVPAPQLDGKFVSQYPYGGYTQQGENHGTHMATIGILCHELSHDLGMFDEYDTGTGSSVVGVSSLMDAGSWGASASDYSGGSPAHLDPWGKIFLGFVTPTDTNPGVYTVNAASAGSYNVLKVATSNPDQYFLIENRHPSGFDAGLYYNLIVDGGVAIWHIDESIIAAYKGSNAVNNSGHSPGVWLEKSVSLSAPYYRNGGPKDTFDDTTTPNSRLWNGTASNVSIKALDPTGLAMQVQIGNSGILNFSAAAYSTNENSGSIMITVNRSGSISSVGSVSYATSNGTATAGADYVAAAGSLTFAAGETSKTFSLNITDDGVYEGNETVNLTLSSPGGAVLGVPATAVLTIIDNDTPAVVEFAGPATYNITEANTPVVIGVSRSGDSSGTSTVSYSTSNGSATAGQDYTAVSGSITFNAGETSKSFTVNILDDALFEGNETVNLALSSPGGAVLGPTTSGIITVTDNETSMLKFSSDSYSISEGGTAAVTVQRTGDTGGVATVVYSTGGGTAAAGTDYVPGSGTLTFNPGETSQTFTVPTIEDGLAEGMETIGLTLSGVSGSVLAGTGSQSTAVLSIADNDAPAGIVTELRYVNSWTWSAVSVGSTKTAVLNGIYSDGSQGDITALAGWSSSNPEVASVVSGGVISGHMAGTTIITATYGGFSKQITVVVR